jgi:hypothetical protein
MSAIPFCNANNWDFARLPNRCRNDPLRNRMEWWPIVHWSRGKSRLNTPCSSFMATSYSVMVVHQVEQGDSGRGYEIFRNLLKYSFRPIQSKHIPRQDAPGATDSIPLTPEHPRNQRLAASAYQSYRRLVCMIDGLVLAGIAFSFAATYLIAKGERTGPSGRKFYTPTRSNTKGCSCGCSP